MTPEQIAEIRRALINRSMNTDEWDRIRDLLHHIDILTAERDKFSRALHSLMPGGSEFANDAENCVAYVREQRQGLHETCKRLSIRCRTLTAELAEARRETVGECIGICERVSKDCIGEGVVYHYESAMTCAVELRALLDEPAPETGVCVWRLIEEIIAWDTSCGWSGIDAVPYDSKVPYKFCPHCGKPIKIDAEDE